MNFSLNIQLFLQGLSKAENEDVTNDVMRVVMKVSALCASGYMDVRVPAEQVTERLYSELFANAAKSNKMPSLNNALLVNLGLLKVSRESNIIVL